MLNSIKLQHVPTVASFIKTEAFAHLCADTHEDGHVRNSLQTRPTLGDERKG